MKVNLIEGIELSLSKDQLDVVAELINSFWPEEDLSHIRKILVFPKAGWKLGESGYAIAVIINQDKFTVYIGKFILRLWYGSPTKIETLNPHEIHNFLEFLREPRLKTFFEKIKIHSAPLTPNLYIFSI